MTEEKKGRRLRIFLWIKFVRQAVFSCSLSCVYPVASIAEPELRIATQKKNNDFPEFGRN